jgi:hypothetical protein
MRNDRRLEEESEPAEAPGFAARIGAAVTARELRVIDGMIASLQQRREHLAPQDEDDRRGGRPRGDRRDAAVASEAPPPRRSGLRRFLIVLGLMAATGAGGGFYSYRLLERAIETDNVVMDDLRDQLAQMELADKRNLTIQAKDQQLLAEHRKTIREREAKIEEYEEQLAQLREKIAALTPPPPRPAAVAPARVPAAAMRRPAPQKTGKCIASGSTAAADLARCVEEFNRP